MRTIIGSEPDLQRIFNPKSIAVVGASSRPGTLAWWPLHLLRKRGFAGDIFPVNPKQTELEGIPCLPSVDALPDGVDLAMISLNAEAAVDAARACADRGVGAVVLPAQGIGETSAEGKRREQEMVAYLRARGTRVAGPNADGLGNLANGALATIQPLFDTDISTGRLAVATQSGATAGSLLNRLRREGLGCRLYASTGNEADLGLEDYLSFMLQDPDVDMVLSFVESIRRPGDFHAVTELAAELGKPIGLIKVGRSEQGAARAAAHTGALAGEDAVYDALFAASGIVRVGELSELVAVARLYTAVGAPATPGVGIMSVSGGQAGAVADATVAAGIPVPPLEAATAKELDEILTFGEAFNPCDLTGEVARDATLAASVYRGFSAQPDIGTVIYARKFLTGGAGVRAAANLADLVASEGLATLVVYAMDGEVEPEEQEHWDRAGVPVFTSLHELLVAHRGLASHARRMATRTAPTPRPAPPVELAPGPIDEHRAAQVLAAYGLTGPRSRLVEDPAAAAAAASELGFPVVCKIVSPDITHKTEIGGVALDLADADAVAAAAEGILARAREHAPDARISGVSVQEQVSGGVEMIAGITVDEAFGPFVLVGLGGVFAEALEDVALRPAPLSPAEVHDMLAGLRGRRILEGWRGAPAADVEALAQAVSQLSQLAADHAGVLSEVDVNPLVVLPEGQGVRVLDVLIATRGQDEEGGT